MKELPDFISKALIEQSNRFFASIEHSQQFLSTKLDEFSDQILKLKSEVVKLRAEYDYLKKSFADLSSKTNTVTITINRRLK